MFNAKCSEVPNVGLDLKINLFDNNQDWYFEIDQADLMISGEAFGDSSEKCYLAVMNNNLKSEEKNSWYIGNILLQDYYVVFDASSRDANATHDNLRIGLGKIADY